MSRLDFAKRNMRFGYLATLTSMLSSFVLRTVFIRELGISYLGVSGLFTNVLGVLSFAELGIGSAMNFSLYKPVAEGNLPLARSLLRFYRRAYRIIALSVTCLGLSLLPFLHHVVKDPGDVGDIRIYYVIFLFNNVISYFAVYKTSIANAEQRNYLVSNINTAASILTVAAQVAVLLIWGSFLGYLLAQTAMRLAQQIFLNAYLSKRYSHFLSGDVLALNEDELRPIKGNIGALVWHKIGDIGVHQTDSIVISAFIGLSTVGFVSNYTYILQSVSSLLWVAFGAATSSFGNLIATGSAGQRYNAYRVYRFIAFWLYGFCAIAMFVLFEPFVTLWIGAEMIIPDYVVLLMIVDFYMLGHRVTITNIKSAAGLWQPDKYLPLVQAAVNLVVSILLVREIGLVGVYIGTLAQGALASVIKPILIYQRLFAIPSSRYFVDGSAYATVVALAGVGCWLLRDLILVDVTWLGLLLLALSVVVLTNALFIVCFCRTQEFRYVRTHFLPHFKR